MTDMWTYDDPAWVEDADLVGYDVHATDGGIGRIGDSTAEAGSARVVVETGFWILGKKRMIPAGAITMVDHDKEEVHVNMTKDEVKAAPDFNESGWTDDNYRNTHTAYYEDYRYLG